MVVLLLVRPVGLQALVRGRALAELDLEGTKVKALDMISKGWAAEVEEATLEEGAVDVGDETGRIKQL
jgi:hypothetical protein